MALCYAYVDARRLRTAEHQLNRTQHLQRGSTDATSHRRQQGKVAAGVCLQRESSTESRDTVLLLRSAEKTLPMRCGRGMERVSEASSGLGHPRRTPLVGRRLDRVLIGGHLELGAALPRLIGVLCLAD